MNRKHSLFMAVLAAMVAVALLFTGCAASASQSRTQSGSNIQEAPAAPETATDTAGGDKSEALPVIDTGNVDASGKKVIYTATMAIEAKDAAAAIKDIENETVAVGGYVADSAYEEETSGASSSVTVRIPPNKLNEFTSHVGTLGKVLYQRLNSQDVTAQYTDTQSALTAAQAQEAQLLEIMKQCTTVEDTLKVREQLSAVQQQIEQYKGQLRLYDNQVDYSTVTITIQQPPKPAVVVEKDDSGTKFWGFEAVWQKIARGFADSFNWTLNALSVIFMVLAYIIIPVGIAGGVTLGIIAIVRARKKKKGLAKKP